jgi:hypothetical protein
MPSTASGTVTDGRVLFKYECISSGILFLLKSPRLTILRFHHSSVDELRRERERTTLESKIEGFRKELGDVQGKIPILAIDALYSTSDKNESKKFREACDQLWEILQKFSERPMEDLENVIRKKDDAERQLEALLKLKAELEAEEARKEGDDRDGE